MIYDQDKVQSVKDTAINSLNVKRQVKSSNQLTFRLSAYTHLRKL